MAFDPLAQRLAYARGGRLLLLATEGGEVLSTLDQADTSMPAPEEDTKTTRVSHPDWSPDGAYLAFTLWPSDAKASAAAEVEGSSVARVAVGLKSNFGVPELLVTSTKPDETFCFPAYSRDGTTLAFMQFKGKLRDAKEGTLWVTTSAGGPMQTVLNGAPMKAADKGLELEPAMPIWWPSDSTGFEWLTVAARGPLTGKDPQLYVLPVRRLELEDGASTETPGIWLPFQDPMGASSWPAFAAQ
jgi:hypothetical protein